MYDITYNQFVEIGRTMTLLVGVVKKARGSIVTRLLTAHLLLDEVVNESAHH